MTKIMCLIQVCAFFLLMLIMLPQVHASNHHLSRLPNNLIDDLLVNPDALPQVIHPLTIPHVIYSTYSNYEYVPKKVWDELDKFAPEYLVNFYDDNACRAFLKTFFKAKVVDRFETLVCGAHKADLFRYCVMYVYGGVYLDIKIKPEVPLRDIFDHSRTKIMYTVLSVIHRGIFQGIIASYPRNEIFLTLIDHVVNSPNADYLIYVLEFYNVLTNLIGQEMIAKEYHLNNELGNLILFQEMNRQENFETPDKYNGYFGIYKTPYASKRLFKARYSDYPW